MSGPGAGASAGAGAGGAGIAITLNGEPATVADGASLAEIVGATGLSPEARGVAVALDGEVVRRAEWATTRVQAGQRVEVLTAVAGG